MAKIDATRAVEIQKEADAFVQTEHDELMADTTKVRLVALTVRESEILGQVVAQAVLDSEEDIMVERANGDEDGLLNTFRVRAVFQSIAKKFISARSDAAANANPNGFAGSAERK